MLAVGLPEAQGIKNIHLINRLRPAMVQVNDMMSVQDVQEILAIPLIGSSRRRPRHRFYRLIAANLVLAESPSLAGKALDNIAQTGRAEGRVC